MGHYRSEMGFEDEDAKNRQRKADTRAKILAGIEAHIERDGVAVVITDLIMDLKSSRVYVGHRWEHWHR